MEDYRAALFQRIREDDIATGEAAGRCLPALLRRLARHERAIAAGSVLRHWHRWRARRLRLAVAEARDLVATARDARTGGLAPRR